MGAVYLFHYDSNSDLKQKILQPFLVIIFFGLVEDMLSQNSDNRLSRSTKWLKRTVLKNLNFLPYIEYRPSTEPSQTGEMLLSELNNYEKIIDDHVEFENEIKFSNKFVLPVTKGKWEVINQYEFNYFFQFKGNSIVRLKNNEVMEFIWIERANLSSYQNAYIDNAMNEIVFKDKYDGCYTRPEYYIVEVYSKGSTHNCLVIRHIDSNKELFSPDDPGAVNSKLKKSLRDRSIIIPPIMFDSYHSYFSRLIRGEWFVIQYMANPKLFNSPKINYLTEESSEFHKANISLSLIHISEPTRPY